jgi:2'-5' RNA ligase
MELKNVYFELPPEKNSKKILEQISQDLEKLFLRKGIEAKVQKNHHITIAYFNNITSEELAKAISLFHEKKREYQGTQTLNRNSAFDQSIHKVKIWESNITKKTHLVLTPHNENAVYNDIIQSDTIQPHINLAQIS